LDYLATPEIHPAHPTPLVKQCRMWWDDAQSLLPKYKAVKAAGWAGIGMWQANGMFPSFSATAQGQGPGWMNVYNASAMRGMWAAVGEGWK
jgi:hypothetical protein